MPTPAAREETLRRVAHPDPLVIELGRARWELPLVTDPIADRIAKGDPTLGWEGDERYALYLNVRRDTWELWRLEGDGCYRREHEVVPASLKRGIEAVGEIIAFLTRHDSRKGYDLLDALARAEAKRQKESDDKRAALVEDTADRLAHALVKDGVV